jgi:acylphosphatase
MEKQNRIRVRLVVSGQVQGVAFRAYTLEESESLGLDGWVRNLPGGGVEVIAEGDEQKVEALIDWCKHGPPAARVDGLDVTMEEPLGGLRGFTIRR